MRRICSKGARHRRVVVLLSAAVAMAASAAPAARAAVTGFADTHNHQFSYLGFGGLVMWGAAFSHDGKIATALPWSDWTPSQVMLCPGQSPGAQPGCSAEVVDRRGAPVQLAGCPRFGPGLPPCGGTSPVLMGQGSQGVLVHGPGGSRNLINHVLSGRFGHLVGGFPDFDGWPRWNNYTGQQVYYEWLKRAHQGGLRLMVMLAVNNEMLCQFSDHVQAFGCGDMPSVDRQIQAAKDLETFIDQQSSGQGWYRIAYSAQQARQIAESGKLAVVLGMEVPGAFGCKTNAGCSSQTVEAELSKYYGLGVRHIFPVHIVDNAFAGTAFYNELFGLVNHYISGDWWDVVGCPSASNIDFHLSLFDNIMDLARRAQNPGQTDFLAQFAQAAGLTPHNAPTAPPPAGPNCNKRGLTSLGQFLLDEMMERGMVIDVDHMSGNTLNAVIGHAKQQRYPALVAGHTGFIETGTTSGAQHTKRHEGNKTDGQAKALREVGGLAGVILHQGSTKAIRQFTRPDGTTVPFACGNSSEAWAQVYLHGLSQMQPSSADRWPEDPPALAIGSDFNGLAGMPAPRFGSEMCAGDFPSNYSGPPRAPVAYPFAVHGQPGVTMDRMQAGNKVFNINFDGLANVGMYPDFIEELKRDGVRSSELDPLFNSAEAYIRMWERAEDRQAPSVICTPPDGQWHANDVSLTCQASDPISRLDDAADASFSLSTNVPAGTETANAQTGARQVCDRRLNCTTVGPIGGNKVDKKAPEVTITAPADGSTHVRSSTFVLDWAVSDGGSGVGVVTPTLDGSGTLAGHGLGDGQVIDVLRELTLGTHVFQVEAADAVGNYAARASRFEVTVTAESIKDDVRQFTASGDIRDPGLSTSLLAKLQSAAMARADGRCDQAARLYEAFIAEVQAQRGKGISETAATIMIEDARHLIANCP